MFSLSRPIDSVLSLLIGLAFSVVTVLFGDPLHAGILYYSLAWICLTGVAQLAKAPPLFTTGAAIALAASVIFYWAWQASLLRPQGLLGFGHLFSLPGFGIAAAFAAVSARRRRLPPGAAFLVGFVACCAGFAAAQVVVCRTMIFCGVLSSYTL